MGKMFSWYRIQFIIYFWSVVMVFCNLFEHIHSLGSFIIYLSYLQPASVCMCEIFLA